MTRKMWKHIVGQSLYQCSVLLVLILAGAYFIPEDPSSLPHNPQDDTLVHSGDIGSYPRDYRNEYGASRHFTVVFNVFVWMQLFNQINCRQINDELNSLSGICKSKIFLIVWLLTAAL